MRAYDDILIAKDSEGFLFPRLRSRVGFPSRVKTPEEALFEFVGVSTYRQAMSFLLDYGSPVGDNGLLLKKFDQYRMGDLSKQCDQSCKSNGYDTKDALTMPGSSKIPFRFTNCLYRNEERRHIERVGEASCVSMVTLFAELASGKLHVPDFAVAPIDEGHYQKAFDLISEALCSFAKPEAGSRFVRPDASVQQLATEAYDQLCGFRIDGKNAEAARMELILQKLGKSLEGIPAAHQGGRKIADTFAEISMYGYVTSIFEGCRYSDMVQFRDFFRALLLLLGIAHAADSKTQLALDSQFTFLEDLDQPIVIFDCPGLTEGHIFSDLFTRLTPENPFLNYQRLTSRVRLSVRASFRKTFGRESEIRAHRKLLAFPLHETSASSDAAKRARLEKEYSTKIVKFFVDSFREGRFSIRPIGIRRLSSGCVEPLAGEPFLAYIFDALAQIYDQGGNQIRLCEHCGGPFKATRSTRVFCSDACRKKSHRIQTSS